MAWTYLDNNRPFGLAHRGGAGVAPENTTAAFANALALGYRYLETDVHRTADGVLVAFHDNELERVAGLPGVIADYDWGQLSKVRLGGEHMIPRLVELFEAFPEARFNIDPKADDAVDPLIAAIREFDAVERVCIGSFSDARIAKAQKALGPELCTSPGPRGVLKVILSAFLGGRWSMPYGCLQIPTSVRGIPLDSPGLIRRVQSMGMQVHYWTINDADQMNRLLDRGADAIITDEIDLLKQVMTARGESV
ncbi:MAG: glycerophosphodiester phosphodiesterase [Acidimicrobiales bacterium]